MSISFELPFHDICTEHQAILHSANGDDFINLDQLGLDALPHIIIIDSKRFKYVGIQDGRGQYLEEI